LQELIRTEIYERPASELTGAGLYVDLPPWGSHVLAVDA
jgi:hypothetical protein